VVFDWCLNKLASSSSIHICLVTIRNHPQNNSVDSEFVGFGSSDLAQGCFDQLFKRLSVHSFSVYLEISSHSLCRKWFKNVFKGSWTQFIYIWYIWFLRSIVNDFCINCHNLEKSIFYPDFSLFWTLCLNGCVCCETSV